MQNNYITRLIEEHEALTEKLQKLRQFLETDEYESLDSIDRDLLSAQASLMEQYVTILGARLERI